MSPSVEANTPIDPHPSRSETDGAPVWRHRLARVLRWTIGMLALVVIFGSDHYRASKRAVKDVKTMEVLTEIGKAALAYQRANGSFPMPSTLQTEGQLSLSWRLALLPYFDAPAAKQVADSFNPSIPWYDPANASAANTILDVYISPCQQGTPKPITNYFAVSEPGFVMNMGKPTSLRDITDGPSETIFCVELVQSVIPWVEPRDLTFDQFADYVADPKHQPNGHGFPVLMADGTPRVLKPGLTRDQLRALFTMDGKEKIDPAAVFR